MYVATNPIFTEKEVLEVVAKRKERTKQLIIQAEEQANRLRVVVFNKEKPQQRNCSSTTDDDSNPSC